MRQIAAKAGVSPTTVAHVLNRTQGTYVAQATRDRVLRAAKAVGYQAALLSQSIKDPLRHLGMVVSDTDRNQNRTDAMEIFEGVRQQAIKQDYITVLLPMAPEVVSNYSSDNAAQAIANFHRTKLIDGFVIDKSCFLSDAVRSLDAQNIPVVTVNGSCVTQKESDKPILAAIVDNHLGGQLATEHLIELGHKRIALLTRPWASFPEDYRPYPVTQIVRGYRDALQAAAITPDPQLIRDAHPWDKHQTYAAVDHLLQLRQPPTAIFASDDAIAVMIIHRLQQLGLAVPADISVVGYGDWSQAANLSEPDLTTVHTDLRASGSLAAQLIVSQLENNPIDQPHTMLPPKLHPRASTAPPKAR